MRIAILTDSIFPYVIGGIQKHSTNLVKYFAQQKVFIDLYYSVPVQSQLLNPLDLFSEEENQFITFIEIRYPNKASYPGHYLIENFIYSKCLLTEILRRNSVDFIYAKGFTSLALIKAKRSGLKLPLIGVNLHGLEMFQIMPSFRLWLQNQMLKPMARYLLRNSDYCFSYGGKISKLIMAQGVSPSKIFEAPAGISVTWLNDNVALQSVRTFVYIGRYERRKGIEEINKVLKEIWSDVNCKFYFIGPIPKGKRINHKAITYYGMISNEQEIKAILDKCDVLICPSYSEGMPNVIMESMARGLAIIATDVGAVNAVVSQANGWLIPPANLAKLKEVIIEAATCDDQVLLNKKKASIENIQPFLWHNVINEIKSNIEKAV